MPENNITSLGACELAHLLRKKELSSKEATQSYLNSIDINNKDINAYITITAQSALKTAEIIDNRRLNGESLPLLAGVPFAVKDNICTEGIKTTCASNMLKEHIPAYNAFAVEKLYRGGGVMLGKLNMDEFAIGSTSESPAFGAVKNPLDTARTAGGSSGGCAAAVAKNAGGGCLAGFTIGSDTGGSVRQPAAFCGVVGLKPSYGRISRRGLVAYAPSLDQIGAITKNVEDCAAVLNVICGHDAADSSSANLPVPDFTKNLRLGVKNMRIALPTQAFNGQLSAGVEKNILAAAKTFRQLGATVEEISVPLFDKALAAYYVIASAEASSSMGRYSGVHFGSRFEGEAATAHELSKKSRTQNFGAKVKQRIMLGTYFLSEEGHGAYFEKALRIRTLLINDFSHIFEHYDLILTPTAPHSAPLLGGSNKPQKYAGNAFTIPVNMAGLPAISVPCGIAENSMPAGLQLCAKPFAEEALLRAAYAFEETQI